MAADGTFDFTDEEDVAVCSGYDQWQWGLEPGGNLICPYKDQALEEYPAEIMAKRYATRKVIYLAGEYDTIPTMDRCETSVFQGRNRNERAKNYFQALEQSVGIGGNTQAPLIHQALLHGVSSALAEAFFYFVVCQNSS